MNIWCIGLAVVLYQLGVTCVPPGENRDWLLYAITGGCMAACFLSGSIPDRIMRTRGWRLAARGLSVYAAAVLSYYFILPLLDVASIGIWVLAMLLADAWQKQHAPQTVRQRIIVSAAMGWFLLLAYSMCRTLMYRVPLLVFPVEGDALAAAAPFLIGMTFVLYRLWQPLPQACAVIKKPVAIALHVAVIWILAVVHLRTDALQYPVAIHHWKAFLEPVASLRSGGWLLWDVPSQYGFLQTLVMSWLPLGPWQSMYVMNAALLVLGGYLIFCMAFIHCRSLWGCVFCAGVAIAATTLSMPMGNGMYYPHWTVLVSGQAVSMPTTGDPLVFPSSGPLRFLWIYLMSFYVFLLWRRGGMPATKALLGGHVLWLIGALWSAESMVFASAIWFPALALIAVARAQDSQVTFRGICRHMMFSFLPLAGLAASALGSIALIYYTSIGQWPDASLFVAYMRVYTESFNLFPIIKAGPIPCWLLLFGAASVIACAATGVKRDGRFYMHMALLSAILSALWVMCSYYIPLSDEVHLICTLPVMVYLSFMLLTLLTELDIAPLLKSAYEKTIFIVCGVVLWGAVNYSDATIYVQRKITAPYDADVTKRLPAVPQELQVLLDKAVLPDNAPVLILSQPYTAEELMYVQGVVPWLLPNTLVGFDVPLPKDLYTQLAMRRAERSDAVNGWVIERKDHPLERYVWIQAAIEKYYRQVEAYENDKYRIRRFDRY